MTTDNRLPPEEAADDDPALVEALHQALERTERGGSGGLDGLLPEGTEGQEQLADSLRAARFLDQFVRHVEGESGISISAGGPALTEAFEPEAGPLPQPFPEEYVLRGLLGEGAFGQVWLADDLKLGIPVALKTIRLHGGVEQRSRALAALENEARNLARLRHPNVVQVHAWRQSGEEHYLVLQYVHGQSLKARVEAEGALGWRQAARYVADVAEALGQVHACGLVHRDIKPANLLWDEARDEVLLTDFGLSAWLAEAGVGEAAGTALYMAPEALQGRSGLAADVYGLAATLFHLVTGEPPFSAPSRQHLSARIAQGLPDSDPRCAAMPAGLERMIRRGLAADPASRPGLAEFAAGLRGCLNQLLVDSLLAPSAITARPAGPAVRLTVFRLGSDGTYIPLAAAQRALPYQKRNLEVVPAEPEGVVLRTGDRVRIEVVADRDGYLTVFNVGPTGDLTLLYPDPTKAGPAAVPAKHPVVIAEVKVTPPAGSERVFVVWSREELPMPLAELARKAADEAPVSRAYRATRNLELVDQSVQSLRGEDWQAAVLELEHRG
jgi:tRNA A-37 threonylcarbamoyl transferase component Bud32